MNRFLSLYARLVASVGTVLTLLALVVDPRWMSRPLGVATIGASLLLRTFQIPLTKYSALTCLGWWRREARHHWRARDRVRSVPGRLRRRLVAFTEGSGGRRDQCGPGGARVVRAFGFYAWFAR